MHSGHQLLLDHEVAGADALHVFDDHAARRGLSVAEVGDVGADLQAIDDNGETRLTFEVSNLADLLEQREVEEPLGLSFGGEPATGDLGRFVFIFVRMV